MSLLWLSFFLPFCTLLLLPQAKSAQEEPCVSKVDWMGNRSRASVFIKPQLRHLAPTPVWRSRQIASREEKSECAHSKTEAGFRDLVSNPLPKEHTEKENTVQDSRQVQHKLLRGLERPEGSEEHKKDEESESAEEGERLKKEKGDGAVHDSALAIARSATGMDRRGNGHASIKYNQGDEREICRTAASLELRKEPCRSRGTRDVVFTTVHLLPRSEGEQCRPTASSLPRLLTGHQAHSKVLDEVWMVRSTHLTELVQRSDRSDSSILQSPRLRPKPTPPGTGSGSLFSPSKN
ncbi:uncharacterized protein LOC117945022 [Etheostoma cragini]|uniref:uncharacterized protein LOC117945022 n=1 Tax=Etheostoma cragini TaxID=417921 RepID=UPI00155ED615|nr:uncharacterized protein LOC117945022 [Etheostoma cragini]